MSRLTRYEKETILLTNELDDYWEIYTHNSALKRKLKNFASKYPQLCHLREQTEEGSVTLISSSKQTASRMLLLISMNGQTRS